MARDLKMAELRLDCVRLALAVEPHDRDAALALAGRIYDFAVGNRRDEVTGGLLIDDPNDAYGYGGALPARHS